MRFSGAAALGLATLAACSKTEPPPPLAAPATPAQWHVECRPLGAGHQACFGPGWDASQPRDPGRFQFYQVSVERTQTSEASNVLFVKRLDAAQVDANLLQVAAPVEVARYDPSTRTVVFDLGKNSVAFTFPEPDRAKMKSRSGKATK
jgi:hypothetical protein